MDKAILQLYCGTTDRLKLLLRGGSVRRYHAEGRVFDQNVAEHTWRVMVIYLHLWPHPAPTGRMLAAILFHDVAEGFTGDVHAPLKQRPAIKAEMSDMEHDYEKYVEVPGEGDLSSLDYARIKCADYLELCITAYNTVSSRGENIFDVGAKLVKSFAASLPYDEERAVIALLNRIQQGKYS